jgi:uncharacterized protein with PQ loop repeat
VVDLTSVHTILLCVPTLSSSKVSDMFVAAIVHTSHTIWMAYNILRFNFDKAMIHTTKVKFDYSVTMSGNLSAGCCLSSDSPFLDSFLVSAHRLRTNEIKPVFRKPPTPPLLKVNTDDSITGAHASCGGIF